MATLNHTRFTLVSCALVGIPGMEASHSWISIPFCSIYTTALLGNGLLLFIIIEEQSLHEPMDLFLAMLAVADVLLSTSTMPKTLSIFWFNAREIAFSACFTQMFIIHFIFVAELAILLAMAFDRYVASCDPLRYTTILTHSKIGKIAAAAVIRGVCLVGSLTYILILQAVFRLPSKDARLKALGTCSSHICVILMFYIPAFFSIFAYRFAGANIPHYIHVLLANGFVIVPPMLNPIVYGMRTRQIWERVIHELSKTGKCF
ncbi:olfactory receptor 52B2-like [Malaclemys terrapin pileata]|uniref:olfactory receptor 52B2-like n=1 Tax=Malaclemys terrapin pileata TaxID=2991368 RepID=UPI0023A7CD5E|nr:olfactory receptor 52B2-like [Malaclemys terrapin pileata]